MEKSEPKEGHDYRFKCNECGKLFDRQCDRLKHYLLHNRHGKLYKCTNCGKSFSQSAHLQKHIEDKVCITENFEIDLGDWLMCKECGKLFKNKKTFKGHMRCHTGEKRYTCGRCCQKFVRSNDLRHHMDRNVCIKQKLQNLKAQEDNQEDISISESECRPMAAENPFKEAENVQPTTITNTQPSQDHVFYQQSAQPGPSQVQSLYFFPSPGHPEGDSNISFHQEQIYSNSLDQDLIHIYFGEESLNQQTAQPDPNKQTAQLDPNKPTAQPSTNKPFAQPDPDKKTVNRYPNEQAAPRDPMLKREVLQPVILSSPETAQYASWSSHQITQPNASEDQSLSYSGEPKAETNINCQQEQVDNSSLIQIKLLTFDSEWTDDL